MTNSLATITPFRDLMEQASTLVKSGFLPRDVNTPEKAVAIMTMGQEVGIGMWAAFNGISVIQGKPTMGPQLMLGLINRSGQLEDMTIDSTAERCIVTMKRKGRAAHTETFGTKEAAAMGLLNKDNYKKQPAVMLKWRAVSACARIVFPDVIMGFYLPEEINPDITVDDQGEWNRQYEEYQPQQTQQLPESVEGEFTDASEPHWTETQNWKTFYTWTTNKLGLSHDEVHQACDVESMKDFAGSKKEAQTMLEAFAAAKHNEIANAPIEPDDDSGPISETWNDIAKERFWQAHDATSVTINQLYKLVGAKGNAEFFVKCDTPAKAYEALAKAAANNESDEDFNAQFPRAG